MAPFGRGFWANVSILSKTRGGFIWQVLEFFAGERGNAMA